MIFGQLCIKRSLVNESKKLRVNKGKVIKKVNVVVLRLMKKIKCFERFSHG